MKKLFISYAKEDETIVEKLTTALRKSGNIWHFQENLIKGPNFNKQIDEALGESDYVLCIVTSNYFNSSAALEEAYATSNANDKKLRMLYFENILNKMKESRPVLSSKWGIKFFDKFEDGLNELIKSIEVISDYVERYAQSQNQTNTNPFCKARADFEDPDFLAKFFFEPEKEKYDRLTGPQAVIMEGGRGSGKTMILRSLEVVPAIQRTNKETFEDSRLKYFGIYMRVHRGGLALSNDKELEILGEDLSKYLFLDDFNLQLTEALIDNLHECSKTKKLPITPKLEKLICKNIISILKPNIVNSPTSFSTFKTWINKEKNSIRQFVVRKSIGFDPDYDGCFSEIETFRKICTSIKSTIRELNKSIFFLLLDEYENFLSYQQIIVNTLIKLADHNLTIKIASKFEGIYTRQTLLGQELQRNHDYYHAVLDYDLTKPSKLKLYKQLVIGVTQKYLENSGYKQTDIVKLLKKGIDTRITEKALRDELDVMLSNKVRKKEYTQKQKDNLLTYYRSSLTHRILIHKRWKKEYSGFNNFLFLSSGIIRFFLDLCGMALLIESQKNEKIKDVQEISPVIQTEAVYSVSHAVLEKLALGAEDHGIAMQKFVMDIGDIFRAKLLYDNNEPETIRLSIEESEDKWPSLLKTVLSTGVRESVFQHIEDSQALKPKNPTTNRPTTYLLNRIYAPGLGINHTARWRTLFKSNELNSVLTGDDFSKTKIRIISKIKKQSNEDSLNKTPDDKTVKDYNTKTLDEWSSL